MKINDTEKNLSIQNSDNNGSLTIKRRTLLKALTGLPVIGFLGFGVWKKKEYDASIQQVVAKELGIDSIRLPIMDYGTIPSSQDLIRVGFIGFGNRAGQLANALGFMHPEDVKMKIEKNTLNDWLEQEYLNVAITGICDVFDLHAGKGLATATNEIRPGGKTAPKISAKRYQNYKEMLADKDIDAVIIATPDHHHARMAIDASKAGKHVYCEKSVALDEAELNELYNSVKISGITYQLGHQVTQNIVFRQAKEVIKKNILGKITLVQTTSNRNTADGAWIRHLDVNGNPKPGDKKSIDWKQWLGNTPYVPFSTDRFYNWTKWFAYNTGMIGQLFTHEYDAVNQLLHIGIPGSATSSGGIYYWKDNREIPDSLHCIFEYPGHGLTLTYSGNLASGRNRGRILMGHDASMILESSVKINADLHSTRYGKAIATGLIDPESPIILFSPGVGQIDAISSATAKYYADRGLTTTTVNNREVDLTHLHLREWLHCIRNKTTPSANIEMAYQEGITCIMAQKSYLEKRTVIWDVTNKKIV